MDSSQIMGFIIFDSIVIMRHERRATFSGFLMAMRIWLELSMRTSIRNESISVIKITAIVLSDASDTPVIPTVLTSHLTIRSEKLSAAKAEPKNLPGLCLSVWWKGTLWALLPF